MFTTLVSAADYFSFLNEALGESNTLAFEYEMREVPLKYIKKYLGDAWELAILPNGAFFTYPVNKERYVIISKLNGYEQEFSNHGTGLIITLKILQDLVLHAQQAEDFSRAMHIYFLLQEYVIKHRYDGAEIVKAVDAL